MTTMTGDRTRDELFGSGGPFEIVEEQVLGAKMSVFKNRRRSALVLLDEMRALGDEEHLIFGDRRISFREHYESIHAWAALLQDRYGIQPGDRVAILGANAPEWLQIFWATLCCGGVAAALNGWWTAQEVAYGLELVEPRLLVGDTRRLARHDSGAAVPVLDWEVGGQEALDAYAGAAPTDAVIDEDDPAVILFTSGTTGFPKGAVLSHRAVVGFVEVPGAVRAQQLSAAGVDASQVPRETLLVTTPFFHVSGAFAIGVLAMANGSKCVLRQGGFDPEDALRLIERERVTSWAALGSSGPRVARDPALTRYDTSSLTRVSFGGAPTSPATADMLRAAFPNAAQSMGTAYGLSECCAMGTIVGGPEYESFPTSVGRPAPTVEIEIRDADGHALPEGEKGEIFVRSPYVMLEYWANPGATQESVCADRWLATGDVGHFEEGRLYVHSRERDMILRSAENIYPVEIENRLEAHPAVGEAAVIGVDHPDHGQEVKAVVVAAPGESLSVAALEVWCREALAGFKVPTQWELRATALPRNASGKVLKTVLAGEAPDPGVGD
jgi:acyl-CoA synthetase (AMP-forming)/AMP-acid ligase II